MYLSELCCPYGGRDARGVHQIGALIPGAAVVTVGDPDGLAILEAGSRGEAHGSGRLVDVISLQEGLPHMPPSSDGSTTVPRSGGR